MSSDRTPEPALHAGIALGESSPREVEFDQLVVSPGCSRHGRVFPLDVLPICYRGNRRGSKAFVRGFNYLFAGNPRSACFCPIVMEEDYKKKNRRLLIAMIIFAVGFTVIIILWKLSIYQKF